MTKIKMSPTARYILRGGFIVANALMFCSALLLFNVTSFNSSTYELVALSENLRQTCSAILFFAIFASAYAEDRGV